MLDDPEVIERIRRDFVAVSVNVTDTGLPEDLAGLSLWRRTFEESAWAHFQFGSFVILDPLGEYALGYADCQVRAFDRGGYYAEGRGELDRGLERHRWLQALRSASRGAKEKAEQMARFEKELLAEARVRLACAFDSRLLTARFLLHSRLPLMLDALSPGEGGAPRSAAPLTYQLAVRNLGEFLTDESPYPPDSASHLEAIRHRARRDDDGERSGDLFADLARRSALALGRLVGQPWSPEAPDLVETAKRWWKAHREDPSFLGDGH